MFARLFIAATLLVPLNTLAQTSPYAGQEARDIKALSAQEVDDLRNARGMGLAKAAELNGYPGPAHALELGAQLGLSEDQTAALKAIHGRMAEAAKGIGAAIIDTERDLDRLFAERRIAPESLGRTTAAIGELQGRLRAVHLVAHLETRAALSEEQVRRYDALRGYGTHQGNGHQGGRHGHGHGHGG